MPSENESVSNINIPCGAHSTFSGCVFFFWSSEVILSDEILADMNGSLSDVTEMSYESLKVIRILSYAVKNATCKHKIQDVNKVHNRARA